MTGMALLSTVQDVRDAWVAFGLEHGWVDAETGLRTPGSALIDATSSTLEAFVSDSRWLADCPCGGGIASWPEHPHGACLDCGHVYTIRFPAPAELAAAVEVLERRPDPRTRYYDPRAGETVLDLKAENASRAVSFTGSRAA